MTTKSGSRYSVRTAVLAVAAVAAGAGLGMPLYLVSAVVLLPFIGFAAVQWGMLLAGVICVALVIIAVVRFARHKDQLCYRHAVLAGLLGFMTVMGVSWCLEYGTATFHRLTSSPTVSVMLHE